MGFRSTGRGGVGISTPGGQNGHQIFLNAELKNVVTNTGNGQGQRGKRNSQVPNHNSLSIPLASQPVAKSINAYNLRSSGTNSPTTVSTANHNKLVRYKNGQSRNTNVNHNLSIGGINVPDSNNTTGRVGH